MKVGLFAALVVAVCAGALSEGCAEVDTEGPEASCASGAIEFGRDCGGGLGFCDSDGACREECPRRPCADSTVEIGFGCVYEVRPNGWTCTNEDGSKGVCRDEVCDTAVGGAS